MSALSMTRRKFVAIFTALTLALATSMLGAAPVAAYAADQGQNADSVAVFLADADGNATSATITPTGVAPTATVGAVTDLLTNISQYVTITADGTYHLDFAVTGGTKFATVNKHKGELTGVAVGTAKVTVYVVSGAAQSNNSSTPCSEALASTTLNVEVSAATSTYGFQGNNQSIKLSSITPTSVVGNNQAGWTNALGTLTIANGALSIDFDMSSGIGQYTIAGYEELNGSNVYLLAAGSDTPVAYLSGEAMSLAQQGSSKTALTLNINSSALTSGTTYTLVFTSNFSAGNTNSSSVKTLGCDVKFVFTV